MAITKATSITTIPIKPKQYIGDSLGIINNAFTTLGSDLTKICSDKLPNPIYLTYEVTNELVQPVKYPDSITKATQGDALTFDPLTLSWIPSAVPGFEASIASAWVLFRAPVGIESDTTKYPRTKILSQFNVKSVSQIANRTGEYRIYFERPLNTAAYAVFATGSNGGSAPTGNVVNLHCRHENDKSCIVSWYPGTLKYGSTISVVVFSELGLYEYTDTGLNK